MGTYLEKISPKEILIPEDISVALKKLIEQTHVPVTKHPRNMFDKESAENEIKGFYNVAQLSFMNIQSDCEVIACGVLIAYARATQMGELKQLEFPKSMIRVVILRWMLQLSEVWS
ncbi:hypothetical protein [Neorickettsia helminthoeca]|uniref:hypothetical protein n=1 Tax=Neorickettsia helminthoeca TaxID=33994 RepID=UPI00056EA5BF|nr:hypothetical protein [Neorickettsia helminthoeca]